MSASSGLFYGEAASRPRASAQPRRPHPPPSPLGPRRTRGADHWGVAGSRVAPRPQGPGAAYAGHMSLPTIPSFPVQQVSREIDPATTWRSLPARPEAPIVLLLHGLGSHEHDLPALVPHLPPQFSYASPRAIHRAPQGWAWFAMGGEDPAAWRSDSIDASAAALERWIAAQDAPVVGAVGFSQGAALALQLLRRDPHLLDFALVLSGFPFPVPAQGDAALAEVRPPVLWSHGGLDPIITPPVVEQVRGYLEEHTTLREVDRPTMGHAVDQVVLAEAARFLQERWDARA